MISNLIYPVFILAIFFLFADPCLTEGCNAPYNIGCRVVNNTAECICPPPCPIIRSPICASDDVQDLSECHMRRQACLADLNVTVDKRDPCGMLIDSPSIPHLQITQNTLCLPGKICISIIFNFSDRL